MFSGSPFLAWIKTVGSLRAKRPGTRDKMGAKCLSEFLKGIYWTYPQAIKPSHHYRSQTRWEHSAHQGVVLGIDSHSLIEMAYMLHRVCSPIVDGECWLMETPRKSYPFNLMRERWLSNLVQSFAHCIITQSSVNGALASAFAMMLFFIWEGFARGSSWSTSITAILLIVGGGTRRGGSSFSLCIA